MEKYYVSAKIANLDLGAEIIEKNPYMAAVTFKETYSHLLNFGSNPLEILDVDRMREELY